MEDIKDVLTEVDDSTSGFESHPADTPNPFAVKSAEPEPPAECVKPEPPAEWRLVAFKHDLVNLVNSYLKHDSAIFITEFMESVAADVKRIANSQTDELVDKYGPQ